MDLEQKRTLVQRQIEDAKEGRPEDFSGWKNKTEVVLRLVMGADSPIYKRFEKISYTPSVYTVGTDFAPYRVRGVLSGVSILNAALLELDLSDQAGAALVGQTGPAKADLDFKVFIVHGHADGPKHDVARFLAKLNDREPVILHEQPSGGKTILEKFEDQAKASTFAVVLLTADDVGRAKGEQQDGPRGRQNVIFEAGFFFGSLGRDRVAILVEEGVSAPGDIDGLVYIPLDQAGGWKVQLAKDMQHAGLPVNWAALGK